MSHFQTPSLFDFLKKEEATLNIASMCSGIGTPELALKILGVETNIVFACEIDKFARETFLANHKVDEKHFYKDIAAFSATKYLKRVHILIFGSPCQPFSIAGYRKGFDDPRGKVFFVEVSVGFFTIYMLSAILFVHYVISEIKRELEEAKKAS